MENREEIMERLDIRRKTLAECIRTKPCNTCKYLEECKKGIIEIQREEREARRHV